MIEIECIECGKTFTAPNRLRQLCSDECQRTRRRRQARERNRELKRKLYGDGPRMHRKICTECGKEFLSKSARTKTCSEECKKARVVRRHSEGKVGLYVQAEKEIIPPPRIIPDLKCGQRVEVKTYRHGSKKPRTAKATVIKAYTDFALCQLKHYKECFLYDDIKAV